MEETPMTIPKDPVILLSFINMHLRDHYSNLSDLCKSMDIKEEELIATLRDIKYEYSPSHNQFI